MIELKWINRFTQWGKKLLIWTIIFNSSSDTSISAERAEKWSHSLRKQYYWKAVKADNFQNSLIPSTQKLKTYWYEWGTFLCPCAIF